MRTLFTAVTVLAVLTCLVGCGGGSTATVEPPAPLNAFEAKLTGSYELGGFKLYDTSHGISWPEQFASTTGSLVLNPDRSGHITITLASGPFGSLTCDHPLVWSADAGLLELTCATGANPNAIAEWTEAGFGTLETYVFLPTNRPDCAPLLVDEGYEIFNWLKTD